MAESTGLLALNPSARAQSKQSSVDNPYQARLGGRLGTFGGAPRTLRFGQTDHRPVREHREWLVLVDRARSDRPCRAHRRAQDSPVDEPTVVIENDLRQQIIETGVRGRCVLALDPGSRSSARTARADDSTKVRRQPQKLGNCPFHPRRGEGIEPSKRGTARPAGLKFLHLQCFCRRYEDLGAPGCSRDGANLLSSGHVLR